MNINVFLHIAPPDSPINPSQMEEIEHLVAESPWFSAARILLLKAMKIHHHPSFENCLAFASLHVARRDNLGAYLQNVKENNPEEITIKENIIEEIIPAKESIAKKNITEVQQTYPVHVVEHLLLEGNEGFEFVNEADTADATQKVAPASINQQEQLVDDFIMHFSATPQQLVFDDPLCAEVDLSMPYAQRPPDNFVSETMIEIYLSQGYFDRAKQTFNKLSLLYPEKRVYFASRFAPIV
jgi:hypothetical protein